jgi:RNA 3'-terminal phosphate cyclase (ATP)
MVVEIDGSFGEGGGQILRTSLTLSALTGTPFRIYNIRKNRPKPGLQHQHLLAVKAVKTLTNAVTRGDNLGSTELYFEPKGLVEKCECKFDVGTAGSVTLILQTILPLMINRNHIITLTGGTDVPKAPTVDYIRLVFFPLLEKIGIKAKLELFSRGHYPEGGGQVRISDVRGQIEKFELLSPGKLLEIRGISHVSSLPDHIAQRQKSAAESALKALGVPIKIDLDIRQGERSKGTGIALAGITEHSLLGSDALGERGVRAEEVGERAAKALIDDLKTNAAVDRHMSDMLMLYAALGKGSYTGAELTSHARTNAEVIRKFLKVDYEIKGERPFLFRIRG